MQDTALFYSIFAGTHYKYSHEDIDNMIKDVTSFINRTLQISPPMPPSPGSSSHVRSSNIWSSQITDLWLVHALEQYPVKGHDVASHSITTLDFQCSKEKRNMCISYLSCIRLCLDLPLLGMSRSFWQWVPAMSL